MFLLFLWSQWSDLMGRSDMSQPVRELLSLSEEPSVILLRIAGVDLKKQGSVILLSIAADLFPFHVRDTYQDMS